MIQLPALDGLRVFDAAARHLSFSAAAEELHLTPSAVSHRLRALETQLGVRLFNRGHRKVELSTEGAIYHQAVRDALEQIDLATRRIVQRQANAPLTLSLAPAFAVRWLLPRLARFNARHPDIDVRFTSTNSLTTFNADEIDMAVRYGRGDWPGLTAEMIMELDSLPVCSPALLAGAPPLRLPSDLRAHTLIHIETRPDDWRIWLLAAGVKDVDPERGRYFENLPMALDAAVAGLGIAIGDRPMVEADIAAGRLASPFTLDLVALGAYYFVHPPRNGEDRRVKAFKAWVMEELGDGPAASR
jgi:LysR family glycine cleavage system transcriptional activator